MGALEADAGQGHWGSLQGGSGAPVTTAGQETWEAMVEPGTRAAMADREPRVAMADREPREAMAERGASGGHDGSGASGGHGRSGASGGHGLFLSGGQGRSGSSVALVLGPATQTRGVWPPPKKFIGEVPL